MRKTKSWKHNRKSRHQYKANEDYGYGWFNPYYDPLSDIGMDKRNTPFMQDEEYEEEE